MNEQRWLAFPVVVALMASAGAEANQADLLDRPFDLAAFKKTEAYEGLITRLERDDPRVPGTKISRSEVDAVLAKVKVTRRYIDWVKRYATPVSRKQQRKRVRSVMHILLSKERLKLGRSFAAKHDKILKEVSAQYDVDVADLLSMMNAESKFGAAQGDFRVVTVFVANMAYLSAAEARAEKDGEYELEGALPRKKNLRRVARRERYAIRNLAVLLKHARERKQDPMTIRGSWAGAIGITQFMPASLKWARDGDGDGRINLSEVPDAIASTANYLVEHGYVRGDLQARKKSFTAYNPNSAYVDAIVAYAKRIRSRSKS
jgi:membrane-bound lytic murein transglycosylase B